MLYRRRQIHDALVLRSRLPDFSDRINDTFGKGQFGPRPHLWRILEGPLGVRLRGTQLHKQARVVGRKFHNLVFVHPEDDSAHDRRRGVVKVNNCLLDTLERFEGAANKGLPCLCEHLDRHVVRDQILVNKPAKKIVLDLRSRGEADFNFLEPDLHQCFKHLEFARNVHGFDQCLIAIAQINTAPDGRLGQDGIWPGTVAQANRGERLVFARRYFQHGHSVNPLDIKKPATKNKNGPLLVQTGRWNQLDTY